MPIETLNNIIFNTAYTWHMNPFELRSMPITHLYELINQTSRISNELRQDN